MINKCPYCGEPTFPTLVLVPDGKGVQRRVEGTVCTTCIPARIYLNGPGEEEPMDYMPRELEIKAEAERRVEELAKELAQARETLDARWETIQDLNDRLKEQTALAETRIRMFNDMQDKFMEVNSKYQSLRDTANAEAKVEKKPRARKAAEQPSQEE